MSDSTLNSAALRETARTLAAAAGIRESAAAALLDKCIVICAASNRSALAMADELELILSRTFASVSRSPNANADLNIVIGSAAPSRNPRTLFINWNIEAITIDTALQTATPSAELHPLYLLLGACYAAAAATKLLTGNAISQPQPMPLVIRMDQLGIEREWLDRPIHLSNTYMAGAGAIGNGVLRAGRHLDVRGQLHIADDDFVDDTNLQRQVYFTDEDIGAPKAVALARSAQPDFPRLLLRPHQCRLQELRPGDDDHWLKRLIVCVDSRRARRELQDEIPGEVFDASTTDIREVIVHHHKQPTSDACMSCIYASDGAEIQREVLLAEGLGLSIEQIRQQRIDRQSAEAVIKHLALQLSPEEIIGLACDTLFKRLCGQGLLKEVPDQQILAPFAFVSVLAGTLLVIELVRRLAGTDRIDDNYWRASAWSPPMSALRLRRQRNAVCAFCGYEYLVTTAQLLWAPFLDQREPNEGIPTVPRL